MRILFAAYTGSWPYVPEMIEEFAKRGNKTEVFYIDHAGLPSFQDKLTFIFPQLREQTQVRMLRRRILDLPDDFDGVNIHFAAPIYAKLVGALRSRGKTLVTSIWGSDFLRADAMGLQDLDRIFACSDLITTNNPEVRYKLVARFPEIATRLRIVPFGLRSLDIIADISGRETRAVSREKLGIPEGAIVVTCGYNASHAQQHMMMVEAITKLSPAAKAKLFFVFPMTYGSDDGFRDEIVIGLEAADVRHLVLRALQTTEDTCRLRIVSDYAVNVQTTDSLSAAIQEHIFAGSTMIVGKWLPYSLFEGMGAPIRSVEGAAEISALLETAVPKTDAGDQRPAYAQAIYDYSSWSATAEQWLDLYRVGPKAR